MASKLPVDTLGKIWSLSDIDRDGQLDGDEFAVVSDSLSMSRCALISACTLYTVLYYSFIMYMYMCIHHHV